MGAPHPTSHRRMRTLGIDLAAQPAGTALAVVEWRDRGAELVDLRPGIEDADVVAASAGAELVGIDCAFGWPDDFVRFVHAHADGTADDVDGGMEWRRSLAYRETDRAVRAVTGRWPLSVSTDRLGLTAMRCAALLQRLASAGRRVERDGSGDVVEVYPGATLRLWGLDTRGYRTDPSARRALLASLLHDAPTVSIGTWEDDLVGSGDRFDAFVAALAARAAAVGLCVPPPAEHRDRARREGWIMLPTAGLAVLV